MADKTAKRWAVGLVTVAVIVLGYKYHLMTACNDRGGYFTDWQCVVNTHVIVVK
jgi:hypothetical protein